MLDVNGEGDIDGFIWTAGGQVKVTLTNVLYVPGATASSLSVECLGRQGLETYFGRQTQRLYRNGTMIPFDRNSHREYTLRIFQDRDGKSQPRDGDTKSPCVFKLSGGRASLP